MKVHVALVNSCIVQPLLSSQMNSNCLMGADGLTEVKNYRRTLIGALITVCLIGVAENAV